MAEPIRVFLLDDHDVVREGLGSCSSSRSDIEVVGESATAVEATARIPALRPDVAVLDARLPDGSGIEVCRAVRAVDPSIKALILTSYDDDEALFAAIMAGASGYVLKEIRSSDLVAAVRHVAAGKSLIDPAMTATVLERIRNGPGPPDELASLTDQERDPARPRRRGPDQPADRRADVPGREDRQELRLQHPRQARPGAAYAGGGAGLQAPRRPPEVRSRGTLVPPR